MPAPLGGRLGVAAGMLTAAALAGCTGSSPAAPGPPATTTPRTPPQLGRFLALPVATPTACPSGTSGSASGRQSPWVGHVDVSVFLRRSVSPSLLRSTRHRLTSLPAVRRVYLETAAQAAAEYARLYTCSADVTGSLPASYRIVLSSAGHAHRDAVVRRLRGWPGVASISCDPSDPCLGAATGG